MATKSAKKNLITNHLTDPAAEIENIEAELSVLKERLQLARGTGDVAQQAAEAQRAPLAERVEAVLRSRLATLHELSEAVGVRVGPLSNALRPLKQQRKIYNLGSEAEPIWSWVIGESATAAELYALVERLMRSGPMTHQMLVEATGVGGDRVSGARNEMIRRFTVVNTGTDGRARWFILPPNFTVKQPDRPPSATGRTGSAPQGSGGTRR